MLTVMTNTVTLNLEPGVLFTSISSKMRFSALSIALLAAVVSADPEYGRSRNRLSCTDKSRYPLPTNTTNTGGQAMMAPSVTFSIRRRSRLGIWGHSYHRPSTPPESTTRLQEFGDIPESYSSPAHQDTPRYKHTLSFDSSPDYQPTPGFVETPTTIAMQIYTTPILTDTSGTTPSDSNLTADQKAALDSHNTIRSNAGAPLLTWDASLQADAQAYAEALAGNNEFGSLQHQWPGGNPLHDIFF